MTSQFHLSNCIRDIKLSQTECLRCLLPFYYYFIIIGGVLFELPEQQTAKVLRDKVKLL